MDDTNDTIEPQERPARSRSVLSSLRGLLITFLILISLWVLLRFVLAPIVVGNQASPAEAPQISALEQRISTLEKEVETLKSAPGGTTASGDLSPLESRLQALEDAAKASTTVDTEKPPAAPIGIAEVEHLKADVEELKKADHAYVRSIILAAQLQERLRDGKPYGTELAALKTLRPELGEALKPVEEYATLGIPTFPALKDEFRTDTNRVLGIQSDEKSFRDNLRSLIRIRRVGAHQTGSDDQSVLARAEAKLSTGDVVAAVKELATLSAPAQKTMEAWTAHAKAYLVAQDALDHLNTMLTDKITP